MTWSSFERGMARVAVVTGAVAAAAWVVVWVAGQVGLWGPVLTVLSLVALGFAIVWVRVPERLPFWSGVLLFVLLIGPVVWSMVMHESAAARVAQTTSVATLSLAALMVARRYAPATG